MKKAFTLIELIFTIVIIGVLASVAIPKFAGLSDNSKIAAELSTAASVQVALDACHGEWIINENVFDCGNIASDSSDFDNTTGYPKDLGNNLEKIIKNPVGWSVSNSSEYRGVASNDTTGSSNCKQDKPCTSKYWKYDKDKGTFTLTSE